MTLALTVDRLLARLEEQRTETGLVSLAFDGDGTLWSGDVAEDVFQFAVARGLLRAEARPRLVETAERHGLSGEGTPSEVAGRIFQAYRDGTFPERTVCEVMTWCFAGWTLADLSSITRQALEATKLDARVHRELMPVFRWARRNHHRIVIVSASPRFIVEQAARLWDVGADDIAASRPAVEGGKILPELASPVPYAQTKAEHARALLGAERWLGAFGDSAFDLELLRGAAVAVAVRPKPALRAVLDTLEQAILLEI